MIKKVGKVLFAASLCVTAVIAKNEMNHGKCHYGNYGKSVIMMIPDGCDASVQTLARYVKGSDLAVDKMKRAAQKTSMANSVITGSGAAATAFACGHKTSARFLGVGPREDDLLTNVEATAAPYAPVASVLEAAKAKGKSVGLVATSRITHATPAAYYCHIHDRGMDNEIMEHLVYQNVDVVFGGGARHLIPVGESYTTSFGDVWSGKRNDGENLMQVLADRDYQFVDSREEMLNACGSKVWGLFDDSHMDPHMDKDEFHPTQPSIAEMTKKAIEILSQNPKGFLLMVEGSQVDWAGHANDAAYMTFDFLAFDEAVNVALDFSDRNRNTTVLAFPDHNTGALTLGHQQSSFPPSYTATTVEVLIDPIKDAKVSVQGLLKMVSTDMTFSDFVTLTSEQWGPYWETVLLNPEYEAQAIELYEKALSGDSYGASELLSKNFTIYGWTTHGHTGEDVPVWTYGASSNIAGTVDNTDLAKKAARVIGGNLNALTKKLFVDVKDVFASAVITDDSDENAICEIKPGIVVYEGKDIITIHGQNYQLKSICVHAPEINTFFIPKEAVKLARMH